MPCCRFILLYARHPHHPSYDITLLPPINNVHTVCGVLIQGTETLSECSFLFLNGSLSSTEFNKREGKVDKNGINAME